MPYDGAGNFTRVHNWVADKNAAILIRSDRMDEECNDYATAFSQVLLRSGVAPMTGDLKMGTNRVLGIHAGTLASPAVQPAVDPASGMYFPSAGVVGIVTGGVERARANSYGWVVTGKQGINTATPRTALDVQGQTSIQGVFEDATVVAFAATGVVQIDYNVNALKLLRSQAVANFSFNIRGDGVPTTLDSLMGVNQVCTLTVEVPMGVTPYYCTAITVDGNAPSEIMWVGGAPTAGAASQTNVYTITVIKTGAATFLVRASLVSMS